VRVKRFPVLCNAVPGILAIDPDGGVRVINQPNIYALSGGGGGNVTVQSFCVVRTSFEGISFRPGT
jgi:hypothetical protein